MDLFSRNKPVYVNENGVPGLFAEQHEVLTILAQNVRIPREVMKVKVGKRAEMGRPGNRVMYGLGRLDLLSRTRQPFKGRDWFASPRHRTHYSLTAEGMRVFKEYQGLSTEEVANLPPMAGFFSRAEVPEVLRNVR